MLVMNKSHLMAVIAVQIFDISILILCPSKNNANKTNLPFFLRKQETWQNKYFGIHQPIVNSNNALWVLF